MSKLDEKFLFNPTNIYNKEVAPNIQEQFDTILKILNKENEEIIGGLVPDNEVTVEQLHAIQQAAPDFYDENRCHGDSPSCKQFDEFITANPQFKLETHVVDPERNDYRFDIVGVRATSNRENQAVLYDWVNSLGIDNQPDEYGEYQGNTRAWWD